MPVAKFHVSSETVTRVPRSWYWSTSYFVPPMPKSLHKLAQMARQCQNPCLICTSLLMDCIWIVKHTDDIWWCELWNKPLGWVITYSHHSSRTRDVFRKRSFEPETQSMKRSFEPNVIPNVALNQDYPNVTMGFKDQHPSPRGFKCYHGFQRSTSQPTWHWTKMIQMLPRTLNQDDPNVAKSFEPRLSKCCQELWTKIIQMLPRTRTILIDRFHRATAFAIRNMLPARIEKKKEKKEWKNKKTTILPALLEAV
jgi:hypothetical protein